MYLVLSVSGKYSEIKSAYTHRRTSYLYLFREGLS